jgi:parallel beta-helix repeat protein
MKINPLIFATATVLLFSPQLSTCFAQGSLNPPGPPGPTMLSLSQIEPRTPVDAVHTPGNFNTEFLINQPGSYYLTTNIVCTNGTGIEITANDVTLDLSGFSLTGTSSAFDGIGISSGIGKIRVYNGIINNWNNYGISSSGNDVVLEHLAISGNQAAVLLGGAFGNIVRDCTVSSNSIDGIFCQQCVATLENLVFTSNSTAGIYFQSCGSGIVKDCVVSGNGQYGIYSFSSTNLSLKSLTVFDNSGPGIYFQNTGNSIINDCAVYGNATYGIYIVGSNNRIENNHVTGSGTGLEFPSNSTNNIVIKNSVEGSANDYSFAAPQIAGPIITNVISGIITNSNPWANFAF